MIRSLPGSIGVPGLEVRCWRPTDAAALSEAIIEDLEHLRPFLPWVADEPLGEDLRLELIAGWERDRLAGGDALYGIFARGAVVGGIGVHHRRADDGLEVGYWLRAAAQGAGTMTRVVRAVTATMLQVPGVTHVEICVDAANARSAALPPRCGYRLVGREPRAPRAPAESGWLQVWRAGGDPAGGR